MPIDAGTAIVVAVFLLFYLRLIILQRRLAQQLRLPQKRAGNKKERTKEKNAPERYSIVSRSRTDWLIAALGLLLMLVGLFINKQIFGTSIPAAYWWIPAAVGGLLINFGFRLYV